MLYPRKPGRTALPGTGRRSGSGPAGSILDCRRTGTTAIHLGDRLPGRSSHLPARLAGPAFHGEPNACLFGVAPDGVWPAGRVATAAVSSYLAFSPLP